MDNKRKRLLFENREKILKDLDVNDIINSLISSQLLKGEEIDEIEHLNSRTSKVKRLLEFVSKGNNNVYDGFVDCLKKDYHWLSQNLQMNPIPTDESMDDFEDNLSRGDVPKLPNHYVSRKPLENKLIEFLRNIKRHEVIIIHGMPCSGKSSLANGTLRKNEPLINDCFSGNVFWVNVSDCNTEEHIVQLQTRLLRKVSPNTLINTSQLLNTSTTFNKSTSVTSLGSFCGSQYYSYYDKSPEECLDLLKIAFREEIFRESLLIIDDLKDKKVGDFFNIGCKILITAQDASLKNVNDKIMQISAELSENESLQLISFYVKQDVTQLPKEAKKLYNLCKGNPLLLSMLGSMLEERRESLRDNPLQWKHYVKQLRNKPNFIERHLLRNTTNRPDVFSAVEMCINSLNNPEWIKAFKSLVIIKDDVKVTAKTISNISNIDIEDVELFIKPLKDKSLLTSHYMPDEKSYQYEIHDLVLTYLKRHYQDKKDDLRTLHVQLLNRYSEINNDLINIPDDGYICYNIGYHIFETDNRDGKHNLFKKLYRNLEFIGNKIRLSGYTSLLTDLDKYSNLIKIGTDDEYFEGLINYVTFHGPDLYRYPDTDILQSILQHENTGILYTEASKLIQKNHRERLYLQFALQNDNTTQDPASIEVDKNITIVRFRSQYIFVGHESGSIALWSIWNYQKQAEFIGHTKPIKSIAISVKKPLKMAATSTDGSLRIWNIENLVVENDNDYDMETESNSSLHIEKCSSVQHINHESGMLCDVNWGNTKEIILTHTNPGNTIIIYESDGNVYKSHKVEDSKITASILSLDDTLAIIAYESNENFYGVHMYCTKKLISLMSFTEYNPILMLSIISNSPKSIFVLTKKYYQLHSWNKIHLSDPKQIAKNITDFKQSSNNCEFITASMGNRHQYIFVATTTNDIHIFKMKSGEHIGQINNYRSPIISMDISINLDSENFNTYVDYPLLVAVCQDDKDTLKLWNLKPEYSITTRKTSKFCCVFNSETKTEGLADKKKITVARSQTMYRNKPRRSVHKTASLDRHSLQLQIGDSAFDNTALPLIATITTSNSIHVYKGNTLIAETEIIDKIVTCITLSPCNLYVVYGLKNGDVYRTTIQNKESIKIMDINEEVEYLEFLNSHKLMAAGKNRVLMMFEFSDNDTNKSNAKMIINSKHELGSQELLDSFATGRRLTAELNSPSSHSPSPESLSSTTSIADNNSNLNSLRRNHTDNYLIKYSPICKCFLLKNDMFLTISLDCCVKIWDFTPNLLGVLIVKQDLRLSCVCLQSNFLLICDENGIFQVYEIFNSDSILPIEAILLFSNKINDIISCCSISSYPKIMALGCRSGNIVIWSISDKQQMQNIHFHKSPVKCVKFSPTPADFQSSIKYYSDAGGQVNDTSKQVHPPMVLVSLAGQIAWWNISHIYSMYNKKQKQSRVRNGNILSPASIILPNIDAMLNNEQISVTSTNGFSYQDTDWEKLWRGKRSKCHYKREDLLACIKLKGEKALNVVTDANFSVFVTIDGGGVLYIMKVVNQTNFVNGSSAVP